MKPLLNPAPRKRREFTEDKWGTFTPFVPLVDRLLHKEAEHFLKCMATALSNTWDKVYSATYSYIRLAFVVCVLELWVCACKGHVSNGQMLMMGLPWPHSWSKAVCLYVSLFHLFVYSCSHIKLWISLGTYTMYTCMRIIIPRCESYYWIVKTFPLPWSLMTIPNHHLNAHQFTRNCFMCLLYILI